jgi:AP2 domain
MGGRYQATRLATTKTQRQASIAPQNKLGVKGVWITKRGKFVAEIRIAGQKKYLGSFDTIQEVRVAYVKAAKNAFGTFARKY